MAYVKKEVITTVRQKLKKKFPTWKFSITGGNTSTLSVTVLQGTIFPTLKPYYDRYADKWIAEPKVEPYVDVNKYHLDIYNEEAQLREIFEIIDETNFDKSDIQTDYFHVGYYSYLYFGTWDKPFVKIEE